MPNSDKLQIIEAISIEAASSESKDRKFTMLAYTGGPMQVGYYDPVVIDLNGMEANTPMPALHNHYKDVDNVVGVISKVTVSDGKINVEGKLSSGSEKAKQLTALSDSGVPLQASVGAQIIERYHLEAEETEIVNGQTITGPVMVVSKSRLREVSVVVLGADHLTNTIVANFYDKESSTMPNPNKDTEVKNKDLEAKGQTAKTETPADTKDSVQASAENTNKQGTVEASALNPQADIQKYREQLAAESERIATVKELCAGAHPDIEAKAIREGWGHDKTKLAVLEAKQTQPPGMFVPSAPRLDRKVLEAAICLSNSQTNDSVMVKRYGENTLEMAYSLRNLGVQELFIEAARLDGIALPSPRRGHDAFIRAAFSSLSLPNILSGAANAVLMDSFASVDSSWRRVCKTRPVNNFMEHSRYRLTDTMQFQLIPPSGEFKHGKLGEETYSNQADTYGIMFSLNRQTIINDDMGAFSEIPAAFGRGAAESINMIVWALILANAGAFFSTTHQNYASGASSYLSITALTSAEQMFLDQTKPNGHPLGISPQTMLVPTALKVLAEQLYGSLKLNLATPTDGDSEEKPDGNPHAGKYAPVCSPYLSNSSVHANASTKGWYLFADPNVVPAFEIAFLNGVERPTIESAQADFNTLGVQFRGYLDFGAAQQDYRGAVFFAGQ